MIFARLGFPLNITGIAKRFIFTRAAGIAIKSQKKFELIKYYRNATKDRIFIHVEFDQSEGNSLLIKGKDGPEEFEVRFLEAGEFKRPGRVKVDTALEGTPIVRRSISHELGTRMTKYNSMLWFLIEYYLRIPFIIISANKLLQFAFNQNNPKRQKKVRVLRKLVEMTLDRSDKSLSIGLTRDDKIHLFELSAALHGSRIVNHPSFDRANAELRLILEALESSGDIENLGNSYRPLGQSVETISKYDEDKLRHREAARQNMLILILTVVIALAAVANIGENSLGMTLYKYIAGWK